MEDMPREVRRLKHGWFGEPNWGACFDDDGHVDEFMRIPIPLGTLCYWCEEPFTQHDSGQAIPEMQSTVIHHVHRECLLRQMVGGLDHLAGRCICAGSEISDDLGSLAAGLTAHEEAWAVDEYITQMGHSAFGQ